MADKEWIQESAKNEVRRFDRVILCDGSPVALLYAHYKDGKDDGSAEVNARLITAAPKLVPALKALMAATACHDRWCPACNCNAYLEHKNHYEPCAWTQAEAAIAKTELRDQS